MALESDFDHEQIQHAMHLYPRHISEEQMRTFENYMAEIFTAFGLDLNTSVTRKTPRRYIRALFDSTEGYELDFVHFWKRQISIAHRGHGLISLEKGMCRLSSYCMRQFFNSGQHSQAEADVGKPLARMNTRRRKIGKEWPGKPTDTFFKQQYVPFHVLKNVQSRDEGDPKLLTVFETECRGGPDCRLSQVIEGPIHFFSLCEHHALPFHGHAYIGYIAHEHIIGLSKLTRLVRLFAKRFTVQERIGQQIADTLEAMLEPHGVAVYLEAHHLCTEMRGVRAIAPITRTTFWRGNYDTNASLRAEFFVACGIPSGGYA